MNKAIEEIKKEVRTIEFETRGISLKAEKIENYFIREQSWGKYILDDVELEDIKTVSLLLMAIYEEFKTLSQTKGGKDE